MSPLPSSHGLYFEEFHIGQHIRTDARTVTENDVSTFASLSGDFNPIHLDAEFSKSTPYGQRVAHGLLILSIISGLAMHTGELEGTVLALREIKEWKFARPVHFGDTIYAELDVTGTKALPRLESGLVTLALTIKNQFDQMVMKGVWTALVMIKP
jgi:3-hydroxybutyryl-CoA dehydratase